MNIFQLERVVRGMAARIQGNRISLSDVNRVLEDEEKYRETNLSSSIRLEGTLEEIRARVVSAVLEEEGMNQSKASKRLGISRSTMWKILKTVQ